MFVKVKSSTFIDALHLQSSLPKGDSLRGVLKDDKGCICRTLERKLAQEKENFTWAGLNDLPYGRYTLELVHETDEIKLSLVKRV